MFQYKIKSKKYDETWKEIGKCMPYTGVKAYFIHNQVIPVLLPNMLRERIFLLSLCNILNYIQGQYLLFLHKVCFLQVSILITYYFYSCYLQVLHIHLKELA